MDRDRAQDIAARLADGDRDAAAALFREAGAPAPVVELAPDPARLPDPRLAAVYHHWAGLPRSGQDLPVSDAIDARQVEIMLPFVAILDVLEDGLDYRYRLLARDIANWRGEDPTGRRISERPIAAHIQTFFVAVHLAAIRRSAPVLTEHAPPPEVLVADWRRLVLPMIGTDGRVDTLLVGIIAGAWRSRGTEA